MWEWLVRYFSNTFQIEWSFCNLSTFGQIWQRPDKKDLTRTICFLKSLTYLSFGTIIMFFYCNDKSLKPLLRLAHFFIMFVETRFLKLLWKGHISDSFNILHSWFPIKLGNKMLILFFTGNATRVIWYNPLLHTNPLALFTRNVHLSIFTTQFCPYFLCRSYLSYMFYADKILPINFCWTRVVYNKNPNTGHNT